MRRLIIIWTLVLVNCSTASKRGQLFDALKDQETVVLFLSNYQLDSVPSDIGGLKNVKRLYITTDSTGWTFYPSLSALPQADHPVPARKLPNEIAELTNLKYLSLVHLNLETLPNDLGKLRYLDTLDLSMNRLVISNELKVLKELKELKYLVLTGNVVDTADVRELEDNNPGLTVQIWFE